MIPALVKAAETYKETSNHIVATLAESVRQRPKAVFTDEELKKLENVITHTRCGQPDVSSISRELARKITGDVADALERNINYTIANALKNATIPVEHTHVIEKNLKDIVDKKMTKTVLILWGVILVLVGSIGISIISYFDGENYWGKQYYKVYTSPELTAEERDYLKENSILLSALPSGYRDDTAATKLQIKRMKKELKKREKTSKKKK
jgi:hypothetical protein